MKQNRLPSLTFTLEMHFQVITDPLSARSKGYGFVRFGNEAERDRALSEMAGHIISNRPVRVSIATAKKSVAAPSSFPEAGVPLVGPVLMGETDPMNTTLFIGGLTAGVSTDGCAAKSNFGRSNDDAAQVSELQLRSIFQPFGDIVYVKIPAGKGCGFVQFVQRNDAEMAMLQMNGQARAQPSRCPPPSAGFDHHFALGKQPHSCVGSAQLAWCRLSAAPRSASPGGGPLPIVARQHWG